MAAQQHHSIRSWALLAVGISSAFTVGISIWLVSILSAPDWCTRILGASQYVGGRPEYAVTACAGLMTINAKTLGGALLIAIGVQALSLLVLIVIVLAGGRLSFKASKDGVEADMSRDRAAQKVADEAQDAANEIKEEGNG